MNLFLMRSSLVSNRRDAPHRRRSSHATRIARVSRHWGVGFTRTGNVACKSELARDLPSKAEVTTLRKLLQMEFGRSCVGVMLIMRLMDGLRLEFSSCVTKP